MIAHLRGKAACLLETALLVALVWAAFYGLLVAASKLGAFQWAHAAWPLWRTRPYLALPNILAGVIAFAAFPIAWERAVHRTGWRELGFAPPARGARDWLWAALLLAVFIAYGLACSRMIGVDWRLPRRFDWMLAVAWLAVACSEECLYRGVVQRRLAMVCGPYGGLVLSAAVFALAGHAWAPLLHNLVFRLPFGLLAGWLYMRSRSLLVPAAAHWVFNFVAAA